MVELLFQIIGIATIGFVVGKYIITPLIIYVLDSIAYIISQTLSRLFPRNSDTPDSPNKSSINSKYCVYNPNPIKYFLNLRPLVKGESGIIKSHTVQGFKYCDDCPLRKDAFNMAFHPIIEQPNAGTFKPTIHSKRIIPKAKK